MRTCPPAGTLVRATGSAASVEAAFGVHLNDYISAEGRPFFAADREPTAAAAVSDRLLGVLGLSNAQKGRPCAHPAALPQLNSYTGHAGLSPPDIKNLYSLTGTPYTGAGQIAGLYEDSSFKQDDINIYFSNYAISIPVHAVSVGGFNTGSAPTSDAIEVNLDIDMLAALAPNLSQIRVYEATGLDFTQSLVSAFTAMANEPPANRPNVISVSYSSPEDYMSAAELQAINQATARLAVQGQTVCVASGDAGAYADQSLGSAQAPNIGSPGDDPYVLSVGGTDLINGYNAVTHSCVYLAETSWADGQGSYRGPIGTGGGGGYSAYFPIPFWQGGAFTASGNPQGSPTARNIPDVALYGDYNDGGYDCYYTGPGSRAGWSGLNGTSASAPLWAAFLADVNQARAANRLPAVGFSNPAIYRVAESPSYAAAFHDVADASNNLFYRAVRGYDDSTGWGSFNGIGLLGILATPPVPSITSFSPTTGSAFTVVTVLGSGFGGLTNASVGGAPAPLTVLSDNQASVTVPLAATTGPILLVGPGGRVATGVAFTVPPPTINFFSPTSGPVGTQITIAGTGLNGATNASVGGVAAPLTIVSDTRAVVTVPPGAATGVLILLGPSGRSITGVNFVVTLVPPVINWFGPTSGHAGMQITLTGTGFATATNISVGNAAAPLTIISDTQATTLVPLAATTGPLVLLGPGGRTVTGMAFTVLPPAISWFGPTSGPIGTQITLLGTNFSGATNVSVGGVAAPLTIVSDTRAVVTVPPGAATGVLILLGPSGRSITGVSFVVTH